MKQLLVWREHLLRLYQNHARVMRPLFRFLISFVTFLTINQAIGYNPALRQWYVCGALALVCTVMPIHVLLFLGAVIAVMHVYYVSVVLALVLALFFAVLYFIYIRFLPNHGYVILAVPLLYVLHIPYVLPIVLGLTMTPVAIIPMGVGILLYQALQDVISIVGTATEDGLTLYNQLLEQVLSSQEMYLTMGIFSLILILVYVLRNQDFSYAFDVAILSGAVCNVILFLIANYVLEMNLSIQGLLIGSVASILIAWIYQFLRLALNYSGVELLQFEDDDYYYFVKAVPKMNIVIEDRKVKRFNAHLFTDPISLARSHKENTEEPSKEETEDNLMEKHDFDFKVAVDRKDFEQAEKKEENK